MKTIFLKTKFTKKNPPLYFKKLKNVTWGENERVYPNGFFIDIGHMPKKVNFIHIKGKNFLSSDDKFLENNKIFYNSKNKKLMNYEIIIYEDYYAKLKEKNKDFAQMLINYNERAFKKYPLQFEIMLDTVTFQNIYNVASIKDKFNLEIKLKIRKNSIFPEEKKHNCIELLRLDVTDLKLV